MDGTTKETRLEERRPEFLVMSYLKLQNLMRKTHRGRGRNAELVMLHVSPAADQPTEFRTGEEHTQDQRENLRSLLYDDFPELHLPVDFPHVSPQWDHLIETIGPMRRQCLNKLSHVERTKITR
jgi:hypothetical protein